MSVEGRVKRLEEHLLETIERPSHQSHDHEIEHLKREVEHLKRCCVEVELRLRYQQREIDLLKQAIKPKHYPAPTGMAFRAA